MSLTRVAAPGRQMAVTMVPRGSRLDTTPAHLSVLSYNLLAPLYVRPIDQRTGSVQAFAAFEWADEHSLAWSSRREMLRKEIEAARADILCLQEVQFERSEADNTKFTLPQWLRLPGYSACIPGQGRLHQMAARNERVLRAEVAIGNALLFRTDRLMVALASNSAKALEQDTTRVGVCLAGREGGGLDALQPTAVFCVHLDAKSEEQRVGALRKCMEATRGFGTRSALIAGDMNTELLPGGAVTSMLDGDKASPCTRADLERECATAFRLTASGEEGQAGSPASSRCTEEQMSSWLALHKEAKQAPRDLRMALERVPTGPTRAAFDHGANEGPCVSWRLDHILFTGSSLRLASAWETLEADPQSAACGLPNPTCPSDHLPVAATFAPLDVPALSPSERVTLLQRLVEMAERHASELAALQERQLAEAAKQPAGQSDGGSDGDDKATGGKKRKRRKKGKQRGPPCEEIIEMKRSHRAESKGMRAAQREDRRAFCESLSELELDAVESAVELEVWVDGGHVPEL